MKKVIEFSIKISYESDDGSPINEDAMQQALRDAIENERVNGALTQGHDEISASDFELDAVNTTASNTLDTAGAIALFLQNLMEHDGVTIEDFIRSETNIQCSYTEDSLWLINGKLLDDTDIKTLLAKQLQDVETETLMRHFSEWADSVDIHYVGDDEFYYMPEEGVA